MTYPMPDWLGEPLDGVAEIVARDAIAMVGNDPFLKVGAHVLCTVVRGEVVSHEAWTATHDGACPPGCTVLPKMTPVLFDRLCQPPRRRKPPAKGKTRKPASPMREPVKAKAVDPVTEVIAVQPPMQMPLLTDPYDR